MSVIECINQNSGFFSVIVTIIYTVATIVICWQNKNSLETVKKQQEQNTGINLYAVRKTVLERLINNDYKGLDLDALLLFSDDVYQGVSSAKHAYDELVHNISLRGKYFSLMEEREPEIYEEYMTLENQAASESDDEYLQKSLLRLFDSYNMSYIDPESGTVSVLNYEDISDKIEKATEEYDFQQARVKNLIQNEIKKSIDYRQ